MTADVTTKAKDGVELAYGLRLDPRVPAPVQLTPANGEVISGWQARVTVAPVPHAIGYVVELTIEYAGQTYSSPTTEIEFLSPRAGKYKWRVWAVLPQGFRSAASYWRSIEFSS
jgi:hypothetical protein